MSEGITRSGTDSRTARSSLPSRLIPSGAAMAALCFFLPWVEADCMGQVRQASGADLGGGLWIVFVAAVAIILCSLLLRGRQRLKTVKLVSVIGSLIGLGVMMIALIRISQGAETTFGRLGLSIRLGAIGSTLGLLLSLIGAGRMKTAPCGADSCRRIMMAARLRRSPPRAARK